MYIPVLVADVELHEGDILGTRGDEFVTSLCSTTLVTCCQNAVDIWQRGQQATALETNAGSDKEGLLVAVVSQGLPEALLRHDIPFVATRDDSHNPRGCCCCSTSKLTVSLHCCAL